MESMPLDGAEAAARVDAAFTAQPRRRFLPASVSTRAELNQPLPIGFGQTNSQPSTVRAMLVLLDVLPGMRSTQESNPGSLGFEPSVLPLHHGAP